MPPVYIHTLELVSVHWNLYMKTEPTLEGSDSL